MIPDLTWFYLYTKSISVKIALKIYSTKADIIINSLWHIVYIVQLSRKPKSDVIIFEIKRRRNNFQLYCQYLKHVLQNI